MNILSANCGSMPMPLSLTQKRQKKSLPVIGAFGASIAATAASLAGCAVLLVIDDGASLPPTDVREGWQALAAIDTAPAVLDAPSAPVTFLAPIWISGRAPGL